MSSIDLEKRKFLGKCGKYAVVGGGIAILMTPTASSAISSGEIRVQQNNGWGNSDQMAPGESLPHNNAENNTFGNPHQIFGDPTPN